MFISIAVVIQFSFAGFVNWPWAIICGLITLFSGAIGMITVNNYVQKTGKQSLIAIILTGVLTFALIAQCSEMVVIMK